MAKLKAPLLSFGASGAIAKAVVYFPWKGLNVAREYVIPANPRTDPQTTQRGYLTEAVAKIHEVQALGVPFTEVDASAYALWGSTYPTPRTWFNQIVKNWLDQKRAVKNAAIFFHGGVLPGAEKLTLSMYHSSDAGIATDGYIYYGTSKTALIHRLASTVADLEAGKEIPDLTAGVKYFVQFRPDTPDTFVGVRSGIYYGTPTA